MGADMQESESVKSLAAELVAVKRQMIDLQKREILLREQILPYLQDTKTLQIEGAKLYVVHSKGVRSFHRVKVLEYIRDTYGDTLADQVDKDCTTISEPKDRVHVRLAGGIETVVK
jgi:hypothetical protein